MLVGELCVPPRILVHINIIHRCSPLSRCVQKQTLLVFYIAARFRYCLHEAPSQSEVGTRRISTAVAWDLRELVELSAILSRSRLYAVLVSSMRCPLIHHHHLIALYILTRCLPILPPLSPVEKWRCPRRGRQYYRCLEN